MTNEIWVLRQKSEKTDGDEFEERERERECVCVCVCKKQRFIEKNNWEIKFNLTMKSSKLDSNIVINYYQKSTC